MWLDKRNKISCPYSIYSSVSYEKGKNIKRNNNINKARTKNCINNYSQRPKGGSFVKDPTTINFR